MTDDPELRGERDVLALAKTIATSDFPVERASVVGVDRESGRLLRLAPFPWRGNDTDPPVPKWGWVRAAIARDERDVRAETHRPAGTPEVTGYVEARGGWRLRWPFVRPHVRASIESMTELARARVATLGFVRPAELDVLQLPLRYRFRCASDDCTSTHELPILDWELHEMTRLARERFGSQWATRFREGWGARLADAFDVHLLVSSYAQVPTRLYVAGVFAPPREAEDEHEHAHHVEHRRHGAEAGSP